jgi:predicted phage terminase large subunit-like protein
MSNVGGIAGEDRLNILRQTKAKKTLLNFTKHTMPSYEVNWHHELMCKELDEFMEDPDRDRLMVFLPPRRGKSELISRRLPAYQFGKNPDLKVIATSYGAELAQSMNRDVQRIIDSDPYRELFPDTQLSGRNVKTTSLGNYVRTSDKFEIVGHSGAYVSCGINGALTGKGADLAIIDDPIKGMAEALSPTVKNSIWDWYRSVLLTRLSKNGKIIIVLTRWAEDDLAGRLLKQAKNDPDAEQWEILCLPEFYEPEHPHAHLEDIRTEKGEALWSSWFPKNKMETTKVTVGTKVWASLYQQRPAPDGGTTFRASWFRYFKELPELEYKAISVDCTFKDTAGSDNVAMGVWGFAGANKYLLYLVREQLDFLATIKELIRLNGLFPDCRFNLIEDKANGPAVVSTLKNKIPGMITYNPKDSKPARATAVSPQVEAGNIWLPDKFYEPNRTRFPWIMKDLDNFVEEFKNFPYGADDDCVDMTTQLLLKVGGVATWFDELVNQAEKGQELSTEERRIQDHNRMIAEKMGWNLDSASSNTEASSSGFGFDLNF